MSLINLRNITLSYGTLPLMENVNLSIQPGELVCLIGRNGSGKTSLLRLLHGEIKPDSGSIETASSLKIALLPQTVPGSLDGTVNQIVASGINQNEEPWNIPHRVEKIVTRLQLNGEQLFNNLSGGLKRRVLLAKTLVDDPDVLLLDEPTNHMDIMAIQWLENFLISFQKTLIFVTHDRLLMNKIANHFVEIDNGLVISWRGNYQDYLQIRQERLETEIRTNKLFDKKLDQEEQWIRQGIKARRTRNEGRVRLLKKMREEHAQRRRRTGQIAIHQNKIEASGNKVFEVNQVNYSYDQTLIIKNFSTTIMRGDKVGIIGPNGIGKSTLIKLLLGKLEPNQGEIMLGTNLNVGYFDQDSLQLDENKTVMDNVSELSETVFVGERPVHIISYLKDFLFSPSKARTLVKNLSGGERNRVMLAKLFSKPCNVLVLDEPTNDLDIETLELLEDQLVSFKGTLLLITHDRTFLNNVVTSTLVFEGNGLVDEYVGGYEDYLRQRKKEEKENVIVRQTETKQIAAKPTKLSYKEQRELSELPEQIENLEAARDELQIKLSDPKTYKEGNEQIVLLKHQLQEIEQQITNAYNRWEFLSRLG